MTEQEAISCVKADKKYLTDMKICDGEEMDIAINALENQIPKKVIETKKFNSPYWQCSKCGCELYSGQIFCDDCGQKLDWN